MAKKASTTKKVAPKRAATKKTSPKRVTKKVVAKPSLEDQLKAAMATGDIQQVLALSAQLQSHATPGDLIIPESYEPDIDESDVIDIADFTLDQDSIDGEYDPRNAGWQSAARKKGQVIGNSENRNYGQKKSMAGIPHKNSYRPPRVLDKDLHGDLVSKIDGANRESAITERRDPVKKVRVRCRGHCGKVFVVFPSELQAAHDDTGRLVPFYECDRCLRGRR